MQNQQTHKPAPAYGAASLDGAAIDGRHKSAGFRPHRKGIMTGNLPRVHEKTISEVPNKQQATRRDPVVANKSDVHHPPENPAGQRQADEAAK